MTAAYILGINMVIAGIFAIAFGVVATMNRNASGARWLSAGYATGIFTVLLEFAIPWQANALPVAVAIFLVYLLTLTFCVIGVARHYAVTSHAKYLGAIWLVSLLALPVTFTLPYGTLERGFLYQLPYFAMQVLGCFVIVRSGRREPLDLLLIALSLLAAFTYLSKPMIGWAVGMASASQGYMASTYAAISQMLGAITLVSLALVLLLVMMRDATAEMVARSETDVLSGILNRRGFDAHAEKALAAAREQAESVTLVAADIDHFKTVNDTYGHAIGDAVIARFAQLLKTAAGEGAVVGRLGGEEFAVLLAGSNLAEGRRFAESVRERFCAAPLAELGIDRTITASFGVAQLTLADNLFDLARRADSALYRAKRSGRNQVSLALGELTPKPPSPRTALA
ncbi:GGDEF domain-containing protein [Pelagerythrobacter marinus]|uniref:GGDEF domain-containing protein n=1 Tax=Pelagerythrobacter marinus TaxID=538382 RepID=UPI0020376504|nr:GGDEF domain-containing protein [Pelagerythrobacter marinus]USA38504.1 GGDEF domain-containing protein [Pelagerythrobacter marinus]WPZ07472.1 GGDEF domain-containing protein [Pelagerythrobacter marinus]